MSIKIFFGVPGSGKTTLAAKIVYDNLKHGFPTYTNVDIKGSIRIDSSDIGQVQIENCDLIIDEAGIDFNSRAYKALPKYQIQWFKLCRHYGIRNLYIFSQSYEDMDITLRRLADEIYVVKRFIGNIFLTRRISVRIGIDEDTHQIIDQYFFKRFGFKFYSGRKYWCMFDSWVAPDLPDVEWSLLAFPDTNIDSKGLKSIYRILRNESGLRKLAIDAWNYQVYVNDLKMTKYYNNSPLPLSAFKLMRFAHRRIGEESHSEQN